MSALAWHVVAHARDDRLPLDRVAHARWLWWRLRHRFPWALGATLMPNHLHLVLPARPNLGVLRGVLAAQARTFGLGETWAAVPPPEPLGSVDKLARQLRYLALNPCRPFRHAGQEWVLVDDPLAWPWSTHRDGIGATVEPWVSADRLARALGRARVGAARRWHRYVSADAWCAVEGTPLPEPFEPRASLRLDLRHLAHATLAATRQPAVALRRRGPTRALFVGLARHCGWQDARALGAAAGCSLRTVRRSAMGASVLAPLLLTLGDPRLLRPQTPLAQATRVSRSASLRASGPVLGA